MTIRLLRFFSPLRDKNSTRFTSQPRVFVSFWKLVRRRSLGEIGFWSVAHFNPVLALYGGLLLASSLVFFIAQCEGLKDARQNHSTKLFSWHFRNCQRCSSVSLDTRLREKANYTNIFVQLFFLNPILFFYPFQVNIMMMMMMMTCLCACVLRLQRETWWPLDAITLARTSPWSYSHFSETWSFRCCR